MRPSRPRRLRERIAGDQLAGVFDATATSGLDLIDQASVLVMLGNGNRVHEREVGAKLVALPAPDFIIFVFVDRPACRADVVAVHIV